MIYAQLALIMVLCALIVWREHDHSNTLQQLLAAHSADLAHEREAGYAERVAYADERAQATPDLSALIDLVDRCCQRLQAPDQAIVEHQLMQPLPPMPQAVLPDDDIGFWEAQQTSKEDLADRLMILESDGGQ